MVKLKTKIHKHIADNEKRRQSLKEKEKFRLSQSQIIKHALASASLNTSSGKKILFDDEDVNTDSVNFDGNKSNGEKNCTLFGDSDNDEVEIPAFNEKVQFSGKKGFKLLNLQSTYGNDERFKIDERFLEDEDEDNDDPKVDNENKANDRSEAAGEKKKMLNILGSVLGEPITTEDNTKAKKRKFDMIRYDASNKEHEIYEIKPDPKTASSSKKKKLWKLMEKETKEPYQPKVLKEKFYEVSREIKDSFKEKDAGGQFSLLETYGAVNVEGNEEVEKNKNMEDDEIVSEDEMKKRNRKNLKKKEEKKEKKVAVAQGIWGESFFFQDKDPRFKDSFEFINKKNSEEANEVKQMYHQTRRKLKEILRLHMKKQLLKKDPFKNKIGGRNKKQLDNFKPKKRNILSKKKPPKTNFGKKV